MARLRYPVERAIDAQNNASPPRNVSTCRLVVFALA
jgi:hypothetical protein